MDLRIVYEYCKKDLISHPLNNETKMAGKDFVSGVYEVTFRFAIVKTIGCCIKHNLWTP